MTLRSAAELAGEVLATGLVIASITVIAMVWMLATGNMP